MSVIDKVIHAEVSFFFRARTRSLQAVVSVGMVLSSSLLYGQLEGTDDFSDGRKNLEMWDEDFINGEGSLSESGGRLEFINSGSRGIHEAAWPWVYSTASYAEDWEFQCDVRNIVNTDPTEFASVGIYVSSLDDERDLGFIEMYAAYFDEIGERVHGFSAGLESDRGNQNEADSFELPVTSGAVRIVFNRREKTLSFFYHSGETSNGYAWLRLAHYGIDGNGGADANDNWRLNERSEFDIGVYGYAENLSIRKGELSMDRFTADGSVSLSDPMVHLYVEEVTSDAFILGWEAFESFSFEIQETTDFEAWNSVSAPVVGDGLYQTIRFDRNQERVFFRMLTTSP